jgi:hypothetical protein
MNIYAGACSCREWKGRIYPWDLAGSRMLHYYGELFRVNLISKGPSGPDDLRAHDIIGE